jgi:hypothetical protein
MTLRTITAKGGFRCHNIEWFDGENCWKCEAIKEETPRIVLEERRRLIAYLKEKKVLRDSMFAGFLVARMVESPEDGTWPILDLPEDLGAAN